MSAIMTLKILLMIIKNCLKNNEAFENMEKAVLSDNENLNELMNSEMNKRKGMLCAAVYFSYITGMKINFSFEIDEG